jgi:hypothetical protein
LQKYKQESEISESSTVFSYDIWMYSTNAYT